MNQVFTESGGEEAALAWLESLGWSVTHGPAIAPGEPGAERADYAQVVTEAFERVAAHQLTRTPACRRESRTLRAVRDTLLPKLMSGELRVKDCEKIAGSIA